MECSQRVEDILDLKFCTDGVQIALQNEDYEKVRNKFDTKCICVRAHTCVCVCMGVCVSVCVCVCVCV